MMREGLELAFQRAHEMGRAALIGYLPAGFPAVDRFCEIVKAAASGGLDILEIGLPVEDAYLDGPVIRSALQSLIAQSVTVDRALEMGAEAIHLSGIFGFVMAYPATLAKYGAERLLKRCKYLGITGMLLVGASLSEWVEFAQLAKDTGVQPVGFIGSHADDQTIQRIVRHAKGFLYVQSYDGQTGQRGEFGESLKDHLHQVRDYAHSVNRPVAVGFGIQTPQDVHRLSAMGVDGVVVGTALVKATAEGSTAVYQLISALASAAVLRGPNGE